jgi:hypothetical protein
MKLRPALTLNPVGTARCAVRATQRSVRWRNGERERCDARFRRLTLRSATGTSQRDVPTHVGFRVRIRQNQFSP